MRTGGIVISVALFLLAAAGARAQDNLEADGDNPLPGVQVMFCPAECLNFTHAKPINQVQTKYPRDEIKGGVIPEAYVWLRYTIGVDGKPHDITPIYTLGKKRFTDLTIATVEKWTFEPALADGKPVPESRMLVQTFAQRFATLKLTIADDIKKLGELRDAGKLDEARALGESTLAKPNLTFAERATLVVPLARMALQRKDYREARRLALMGTMPTGYMNLILKVGLPLLQVRIETGLQLGEYVDAINAYTFMMSSFSFEGENPYTKPMNELRAKLKPATHLVSQSKIPTQEEGGVYWHQLYRRTFGFANVTGSLEKFVLSCNGSNNEGAITLQVQWHVPLSWENCNLFVHGAPGTTFSIVETDDDETQKNEVMARYDAAVRANPTSTTALMGRARANRTALKPDAAIADFSRAIELDPKLAAAYSERANLYLQQGKYAAGLADAEAALKLDPKYTQARGYRAFANQALGNYPKALADYGDMISAKDNSGYIGRAVTYFAQGNYSEAEKDIRSLLNGVNRGDLGTTLWLHLSRLKQELPADPLFVNNYPRMPKTDWRMELAELFREKQAVEQTESHMKTARENPLQTLQTNNWPCAAKFYLGEYKLMHGDTAGARADFTQMITDHCYAGETAAAAAELKRLPGN